MGWICPTERAPRSHGGGPSNPRQDASSSPGSTDFARLVRHAANGKYLAQQPVQQVGVGVGDVVDGSYDLFGVPGVADLAVWVAGGEQAEQLGLSVFVETLMGLGQQASGSIERIMLASPVSQRVVLHPSTALVELGVGQLHQMKRVGDRRGPKTPTSPPSAPGSPDGEGPTRPPSQLLTPSWMSPGTCSPTVLSMTTLAPDSSSPDTIRLLRRSGSSTGLKTSASRSASPQLLHSVSPTPAETTADKPRPRVPSGATELNAFHPSPIGTSRSPIRPVTSEYRICRKHRGD